MKYSRVFSGTRMETCEFPKAVTARVRKNTCDFLDRKAAQLGVSRAETMRNVVQFYKQAHRVGCPECGTRLSLDP